MTAYWKCTPIFVIILLLMHNGVTEEDLYKILGVRKSASSQEIKKAYKKLAKEW